MLLQGVFGGELLPTVRAEVAFSLPHVNGLDMAVYNVPRAEGFSAQLAWEHGSCVAFLVGFPVIRHGFLDLEHLSAHITAVLRPCVRASVAQHVHLVVKYLPA